MQSGLPCFCPLHLIIMLARWDSVTCSSDGREGFGGSAPGPPLREGPTTSSRGDGDGDEDERDRGRVRSGQDRSDKRRGGG